MKYSVSVTATYIGHVEIDADSGHEASKKAFAQINSGDLPVDLYFSKIEDCDTGTEILDM